MQLARCAWGFWFSFAPKQTILGVLGDARGDLSGRAVSKMLAVLFVD